MLDVKWIRDNPDAFVAGLEKRAFGAPRELLNQILTSDEQRRVTIQELQDAQAKRNAASKDIGTAKQAKDEAEAKRLMDEVVGLKASIQDGEDKEREQDKALGELLAGIPNMPAEDVPVGADEDANMELRKVGEPPKFDFEPKQHFELGEALGLMDFETAAKLSGSRFVVLKGSLARLERALSQFMLDLHTSEHGYTEVNPPLLVRDEAMFGTAQLPKFADDQFGTTRPADIIDAAKATVLRYAAKRKAFKPDLARKIIEKLLTEGIGNDDPLYEGKTDSDRDEFIDFVWQDLHKIWRPTKEGRVGMWLIPTAEVPLTNLVRDDITDEAKLPMRVTASTPCFRAEAGAAGRDTRGMIRQ
ncbi:MAG: serine--tRNA ligase, partial [Hyphomicrobiaceae bacterium]|nr:serine--tRNA ligase [Hyphomicrobiaceae bacterium]MDX2450247.1 serine--tRNA ligase [Hyphomicrobiaceae bacterium]